MSIGTVALVGAGPGSIDHLTIGALRAIESAEVILYDALIGAAIRALFPALARTYYVGKRCGQHALSQPQINQLLIEQAALGLQVVRLKGGDPLIFGRGAEEIAALRAAGIAYRVVPGISALNGIAAEHALPLTARDRSHEFRVIQGHHLADDPSYWHGLATYQGTLVIYMGLERLALIVERLRCFGADRLRPIAVIESASDGSTRVTRSTLGTIQREGFERQTQGPGIIYIGSNVELMDDVATPYFPARKEAAYGFATAHFS